MEVCDNMLEDAVDKEERKADTAEKKGDREEKKAVDRGRVCYLIGLFDFELNEYLGI